MTDKVDTTNNEANANFSGMPSLETLWQVQQNEGSDGFYRTYIEAAKTAQTIIHNNLALLQQQAAVLAEAVAALDMQVAVAAELKERNDFFCKKTFGRGCKYNPHSEFNLRGLR